MRAIDHALSIAAPTAEVYDAVTTLDGLSSWWTRNADVGEQVGDVSTFRFRSGAFNRMRIEALDRPTRVVWECVDGHEEWIGTQVKFDLTDGPDGTELDFTHGRFREATEYVAECGRHWEDYLRSLKAYCESGTGAPDPGRSGATPPSG